MAVIKLQPWANGLLVLLSATALLVGQQHSGGEEHLLYVASPGIRNYTQYGGVGILVFDIDHGFRFVKRIPTWDVPPGQQAENVKGIAASAENGRAYVTTLHRIMALDAVTGRKLWDKAYEGGCDRLAISPDGRMLYVPQLEGNVWHVVDAATGGVIAQIESKSGSHNTICSLDGSKVYLASLRSPLLLVADAKNQKVVSTVGPFSNFIRPFTINGSDTLCFVNVDGLLGFEVGDVRTGQKLYRVEVQGYRQGPVKRHACPSHGIALTPTRRSCGWRMGPTMRFMCSMLRSCRPGRPAASNFATCPAGSASAWTAGSPTLPPEKSSMLPRRRSWQRCRMRLAARYRARRCWTSPSRTGRWCAQETNLVSE